MRWFPRPTVFIVMLLSCGFMLFACQGSEHGATTGSPVETMGTEGDLDPARSAAGVLERAKVPPSEAVERSNAATFERAEQRGPETSFDRGGYRHTYTPLIWPKPIGLVVLGTTDKLWKARRLARKARTALGLAYNELRYEPNFGFVFPRSSCIEEPYPCGPGVRFTREPSAYVAIERGYYERWRSGEFIVSAAHGPPGSDLLRETLGKAKPIFPEAYEETTRHVWIDCTQRKLRADELPATEGATKPD